MALPQTYQIQVLEKNHISTDLVHLRLNHPTQDPGLFAAGQFMSILLPGGLRRSYSIASSPMETSSIDLLINLRPNGPGSRYLRNLQVGDEVSALLPLGNFLYLKNDRPAYFIATGVGVAPFLSMLKVALQEKVDSPLTLIFGVRHECDLQMIVELEKLASMHENLNLIKTVSRPGEEWAGMVGRVTDQLPELRGDVDVYLCGGTSMIMDVKDQLLTMGIPGNNIFYEQFY